MLTSPQIVTISTVANNLDRVESEKTSSIYKNNVGTLELKVSHQTNKTRVRHMARIDKKVLATDPLTAVQSFQSLGLYVVIDEPSFGFSDEDILAVWTGFKTWATDANINAILASRH